MKLTWLPDVLVHAGIKVVLTPGWLTRSHGELAEDFAIVWHHDASPPGDSPGALGWMINNWPNASAQCWVDRYGVWHLVGVGVAWHAGATLPGMPNNYSAIGIETDHTTGEDWPPALLDSLRQGTAAIFKARNRDSSALHFHKTICSPPGRKSDPDGLDLATERAAVAALMAPVIEVKPSPPHSKPPTDWLDMATEADLRRIVREELKAILDDDQATDEKITNPATGVRQSLGARVRSTQATASRTETKVDQLLKKAGIK